MTEKDKKKERSRVQCFHCFLITWWLLPLPFFLGLHPTRHLFSLVFNPTGFFSFFFFFFFGGSDQLVVAPRAKRRQPTSSETGGFLCIFVTISEQGTLWLFLFKLLMCVVLLFGISKMVASILIGLFLFLSLKWTGSDIDRGRSKVTVDVKPVARILCSPTVKLWRGIAGARSTHSTTGSSARSAKRLPRNPTWTQVTIFSVT